MKVIAHISDLHFGAEDQSIAAGLLHDLRQVAPALIIASGDFTQRARRKQFVAARTYLDQIHCPRITVPGNHDIPLYDVFRRFLAPLTRYKHLIYSDVNPWFEDEEVAILGLNTARSLTWKSGRLSRDQIELIRTRFPKIARSRFRIIVTHHPFIPPPGDVDAGIDLVGGVALALPVIDECCVDLLLAGHLHQGYTGVTDSRSSSLQREDGGRVTDSRSSSLQQEDGGDVRAYYPATNRSIIVAQAGTAISWRIRKKQPNGYNVLFLEGRRMTIAARAWAGTVFKESTRATYDLVDQEWKHRS